LLHTRSSRGAPEPDTPQHVDTPLGDGLLHTRSSRGRRGAPEPDTPQHADTPLGDGLLHARSSRGHQGAEQFGSRIAPHVATAFCMDHAGRCPTCKRCQKWQAHEFSTRRFAIEAGLLDPSSDSEDFGDVDSSDAGDDDASELDESASAGDLQETEDSRDFDAMDLAADGLAKVFGFSAEDSDSDRGVHNTRAQAHAALRVCGWRHEESDESGAAGTDSDSEPETPPTAAELDFDAIALALRRKVQQLSQAERGPRFFELQRRAQGAGDFRPLFRVFHAWASMAGWSWRDERLVPEWHARRCTNGRPGWGVEWQIGGFDTPPSLRALVNFL
jgi:hypothetical protein